MFAYSEQMEAYIMQRVRTLSTAVLAFALSFAISSANAAAPKIYKIELIPPPQLQFHDRMGGWPKEISPRTFHAADGTLTIYAHDDGRTDLVFEMRGLLPYGVYTLWDVVNPDFDNFADRPLANVPKGVDATKPHWWNDVEFDRDGGPDGFGAFGFMADQQGKARVVVNLDHRPGVEFLLDYHADGHVRGGKKGVTVFPGVLWAKFPTWETPKN